MVMNDPCLEIHTVDISSIRAGESLDWKYYCPWKRRRELLERLPYATIREFKAAHQADKDICRPTTTLGIVRPF